jgi:hypothetical protein
LQAAPSPESYGFISCELSGDSYHQPLQLRFAGGAICLFDGEQRSGFDSLFALVSWQVWKERNARCFRGQSANFSDLLQLIKAEADCWIQAGAGDLGSMAAA